MSLHEIVGNMHMHTPYSDGAAYHEAIAEAARTAKLDFIIVTDHNIYLSGVEGYYHGDSGGQVLVLSGEEVHDRTRLPQVNHLLVYNTNQEMTEFADDPQTLINEVDKRRGLAFLAHPKDGNIPWMAGGDGIAIPWVDWNIRGYHGLEIWNYMADWKATLPTFRKALKSIRRPEETVIGPRAETLACWDSLLGSGERVTAIGNSDAHGLTYRFGPLKYLVFAYDFLFSCVNTHILLSSPMIGDLEIDRALIYDALRNGRTFVGYDLIGSTRGFRFSAQGMDGAAEMGDTLRIKSGITLQTLAPQRAHIKIIRHGEVVAENEFNDALVYTAQEPGAYRVEVWKEHLGKPRCWILSSPIYIVP